MVEHLHDPHFWVTLAFAVFVVLVVVFARHKIINMVDARRHKIAGDIAKSAQLLQEADNLKREAEQMLIATQIKSKEILEQAGKDAQTLIAEATLRAERNAEKKMQALQSRIAQEEQRIMADAKVAVAELSVQLAREVLRDNLNGKQEQAVFKQSLQSISSQKIGA